MSESQDDDTLDVESQRFSIVPEWVLDLPLSDTAFRLYTVLLRYGGSSGQRMPSRRTLMARLHKKSLDTVDRAMRELEAEGVVLVERRRVGGKNLTNRYHVRTSGPGRNAAATPPVLVHSGPDPAARSGRSPAATGGRTRAARVAAPLRPDRDPPTESRLTQPEELTARVREARTAAGLSASGWAEPAVRRAIQRALERGHPADRLPQALLIVARDPASRSPLRVAESGPWWSVADLEVPDERDAHDALLDTLDGARVHFQRRARAELTSAGLPLTRAMVLRRAAELAGLLSSGDAPAPGSSISG